MWQDLGEFHQIHPNRQMIRGDLRRPGVMNSVLRHGQTLGQGGLIQRDTIQRPQRARRGKRRQWRHKMQARCPALQCAPLGPIIEIARNHGGHAGQLRKFLHQMLHLLATRPGQQPQMRTNHPQRANLRVKLDPNRAVS